MVVESEGDGEILLDTGSSTISEESQSESEVQVSSSSSQTGLSQPNTLQQEFSLININIRNINFEKVRAMPSINSIFCNKKHLLTDRPKIKCMPILYMLKN